MIAFVSLFLGLIAGPQPVELTVSGEVAAVELRLDGVSQGVLRGEPWTLVCDLGPGLAPHRLEAVGLDEDGREVERIEQWINLPRSHREVELVLEQEAGRAPHGARLLWTTVAGDDPEAVTVTFDGAVLEVADPRAFPLPPYDVEEPHLLQAELQFGSSYLRADRVVGGPAGDEVGSALTAFPVFLAAGEKRPQPQEMDGWFTGRGRPLRVVAVEDAPADLMMVQDASARLQDRLGHLAWQLKSNRTVLAQAQIPTGLKHRDRFRLVYPFVRVVGPAGSSAVFPFSPDLARLRSTPGSLARHLEGVLAPFAFPPNAEQRSSAAEQRLADAVAIAGLSASGGQRARAVLLLASAESPDRSRFKAAAVREFLRQLQVPLVVWAPLGEREIAGWGAAHDVSSRPRLLQALRRLRETLDRQVVVWLEGRYQPQEIALSSAAAARFRPATGDLAIGAADAGDEEEEAPPAADAVAAADTAADTEEATAADTGAPADLAETFADTVDVHVVNVEAIVTDRDGRRVRDLGRDDFEVFEDGEPVVITNFLPPEPEAEPANGAAPAGEAAGEAPAEAAAEATAGVGNPLYFLVFIDARHLDLAQRSPVIEALRATLADLPAGTRAMLLSSGDTSLVQGSFTDDPAALAAALAALERTLGAPPAETREGRQLMEEMLEVRTLILEARRSGDPNLLALAEMRRDSLLSVLRLHGQQIQAEVRATVETIGQLAASLGGLDGRKALLYVGDHLTLTPAAEVYTAAEHALELDELSDSRLAAEAKTFDTFGDFQQMVRQANANGVTFYTLAPPSASQPGGVETASAGPSGFHSALRSARDASVEEGSCFLTRSTGGVCQVRGAEPRQLVAEAFDDGAASYSLGYAPAREPDGKLHSIEVKVKRPGLSVRHREGYFDKPREDRLHDLLSAALLFGGETDALGVQLTFEAQQPLPKGTFLVPVDVRLPAARLAMLPSTDGAKRNAKARLLVSTMDAQGRVAAAQEFPIAFAVAEEKLRSGTAVIYSHKVHLTLAAGVQKVAIGVWDETGRAGSFLRRTVTVGESAP